MEKQERTKYHFNAAEFIEGLIEEERTGIKKEKKFIEERG
jgi:hypothetical protein